MNDVVTQLEALPKESHDSLWLFLLEVKKLFPILEIKESLRATHRGLFVEEKFVDKLSKAYQEFLEKQTKGEIHKSEEKAKKRLFGSLDPEGYYLIEGKNCLSGFLVAYELKEPQKLGLPYYLGSLSSKKNFLHPEDPVISGLKDVEIISEASGAGLKIKAGNQYFSVSPAVLGYFIGVARNSHRTMREFPELEDSLGVQCRAFVSLFRKARPIPGDKLLLVPEAYSMSSKYDFRLLGSTVFITDKRQNVLSVYGLQGKDLYRLFRREFNSIRNKRLGSFEIYNEKHKLLGTFRYSERQYQLSTQALMDFTLEISRSPDKKDNLKGVLTAKRVFERYSEIFQTSQPIQRGLVKSYLEKFKKPISECRINGVWIFVIGHDAVIEATVPKF
jgi:hypothetical protein